MTRAPDRQNRREGVTGLTALKSFASMPKQAFSRLFYLHYGKNGKNISNSASKQETKVLIENRTTMFSLRTKERIYARLRRVPNLFP